VNPRGETPRIVFLCVENSCRSQMAEAFARAHGGGRVRVWSAGSRPSGKVNPRAIETMAERGLELGRHRSKSLADLPAIEFDLAVTMGCGDACPDLRAAERLDWQIEDPAALDAEGFARVRDEIERRVLALLARTDGAAGV
jgi:protein-tyrosine-phosphatase